MLRVLLWRKSVPARKRRANGKRVLLAVEVLEDRRLLAALHGPGAIGGHEFGQTEHLDDDHRSHSAEVKRDAGHGRGGRADHGRARHGDARGDRGRSPRSAQPSATVGGARQAQPNAGAPVPSPLPRAPLASNLTPRPQSLATAAVATPAQIAASASPSPRSFLDAVPTVVTAGLNPLRSQSWVAVVERSDPTDACFPGARCARPRPPMVQTGFETSSSRTEGEAAAARLDMYRDVGGLDEAASQPNRTAQAASAAPAPAVLAAIAEMDLFQSKSDSRNNVAVADYGGFAAEFVSFSTIDTVFASDSRSEHPQSDSPLANETTSIRAGFVDIGEPIDELLRGESPRPQANDTDLDDDGDDEAEPAAGDIDVADLAPRSRRLSDLSRIDHEVVERPDRTRETTTQESTATAVPEGMIELAHDGNLPVPDVPDHVLHAVPAGALKMNGPVVRYQAFEIASPKTDDNGEAVSANIGPSGQPSSEDVSQETGERGASTAARASVGPALLAFLFRRRSRRRDASTS